MKKNVIAICVVLVACLLALCILPEKTENASEASTASTETKAPIVTRDFDEANIESFQMLRIKMERDADKVFNDFVKNGFQITPEFLEKIYLVEEEYGNLMEERNTLTVEEYEYIPENFGASIYQLYASGDIREPIMEVHFEESRGKNRWCYLKGKIELEKGYDVYVEYTQNLKTSSKPDDYDKVRTFEVINPEEDAYLVFSGKRGYEIIRVMAKE